MIYDLSEPIPEKDDKYGNWAIKLPDKVRAEYNDLLINRARVIERWAELEMMLALLFSDIIQSPHENLAYGIYYTPNATETRIALLDTAVHRFTLNPPEADKRFKDCWQKVRKRINSIKSTRNIIVHGDFIQIIRHDGLRTIRLTQPNYNFSSKHEPLEWFEKGQLPGMCSNDLSIAHKAISLRAEWCERLRNVLLILDGRGQGESWQDILSGLVSRPWSTLNKSRGESTLPRKHSIREFSMFTRENSALPLGIIAPLSRLRILKAIPGTRH